MYKMNSKEIRSHNDLEQLKRFCEQPKVYGFISNLWFHALRNKYPVEFLEFTSMNEHHSYFRKQIIESLNAKKEK
jgi:hypothetical protein